MVGKDFWRHTEIEMEYIAKNLYISSNAGLVCVIVACHVFLPIPTRDVVMPGS
jgi:hypothetical protein